MRCRDSGRGVIGVIGMGFDAARIGGTGKHAAMETRSLHKTGAFP